jgi:hypothetical protein
MLDGKKTNKNNLINENFSFLFSSAEYERVNAEFRLKISTLEIVTASLKNGLVHSFQRKGGVSSKF